MKKNFSSLHLALKAPDRVFATCFAICALISASGFAQTWIGGGDDNFFARIIQESTAFIYHPNNPEKPNL
ncbi:MAG: hypothetical protein WC765_05380 [Phycisphaerae bacterium]|jgi:hypothetical protein